MTLAKLRELVEGEEESVRINVKKIVSAIVKEREEFAKKAEAASGECECKTLVERAEKEKDEALQEASVVGNRNAILEQKVKEREQALAEAKILALKEKEALDKHLARVKSLKSNESQFNQTLRTLEQLMERSSTIKKPSEVN